MQPCTVPTRILLVESLPPRCCQMVSASQPTKERHYFSRKPEAPHFHLEKPVNEQTSTHQHFCPSRSKTTPPSHKKFNLQPVVPVVLENVPTHHNIIKICTDTGTTMTMKGDLTTEGASTSNSSSSNHLRSSTHSASSATSSSSTSSLFSVLSDLPSGLRGPSSSPLTTPSFMMNHHQHHHMSRRQRNTASCGNVGTDVNGLCLCCTSRRERVLATLDAVEQLLREDSVDPTSPFFDPSSLSPSGRPSSSYKRMNSSREDGGGDDSTARQ